MEARYRRAVPPVEHDRQRTHAPTRVRAADPQPSSSSGISVGNLAIASASSVIAAVVVSHVWGSGTLIAAAVTPVIVTLTSEALRRPQKVIKTVVETRSTSRFDPVAEGRRGIEEGDAPAAAIPPGTRAGDRTVHRVDKRVAPVKRPVLAVALATGLIAFVIAGFLLTGSELVLGKSVGGKSSGTTLLGGGSSSSKTKTTTDQTTTGDTKTGSTTSTAPGATTTGSTDTTTTPTQTAPTQTTPGSGTSTAPQTTPAPQQNPAPTTTTPSGGTAAPTTTTP
jgi:hypothetical protein